MFDVDNLFLFATVRNFSKSLVISEVIAKVCHHAFLETQRTVSPHRTNTRVWRTVVVSQKH